MERLHRLLFDSRMKLFSILEDIEGMRLSEICPLAEMLIKNDPWLSEQGIIDSACSGFGGKIREDAYFVRNSFERQFNTLSEIVWMLVYKSVSEITFTGPYVSQIPNFEIRRSGDVWTLHRMGWCELIWSYEVTRAGAVLLHWLHRQGELPGDGEPFIECFSHLLPDDFEKHWQNDMS